MAALLGGCSDSQTCAKRSVVSDSACSTSQDCVDMGFQSLVCLDGLCRRTCVVDSECLPNKDDLEDEPDICLQQLNALPPAICEAQVCEIACPDAPCGSGESCRNGRCVYAYEGFEIPPGDDLADLRRQGWNGIETEFTNPKTEIVFRGILGCDLGDERCAGPASEGERFATLERQSLQVREEVAPTCRPCACCLQCQLSTADEWLRAEGTCPGERPMPLACPATTPAYCQNVCDACTACTNAPPERVGMNLTSCEVLPAQKTCSSCAPCESDVITCTAATCPMCAAEPNSAACITCVQDNCLESQACQDCRVCDAATSCLVNDPGSAACIQNVTQCEALGDDGCFPAAISYGRAVLNDLEQALVSDVVDLSQASGQVVLQFDYVPFNVAETYRPGVQQVAPQDWPVVPQEVRVDLCGGSCESEASWQLGTLDRGGMAVIPPVNRRNNGLLLGSQTPLDWTAGQVRVVVPEALRTPQFRFRFVPSLATDTRVGIDNVMVRRLP